ncbi:MAG: Gfo/Idh/MocA family oxidoreductase [Candidatus Lokiarchaeota archaeon]|nr:Gfo/Idh/MocA family oxidoreductase [Candidatus Lokiarchaeota archaeon]
MTKDWINVAAVGAGRIFQDAHRKAYTNAASTNYVVIALCDIRKDLVEDQLKALKKEYDRLLGKAKKKEKGAQVERLKFGLDHLKAFTDFGKMLDAVEGNCDLVDNCTPGRTHVPLSVQAMEHGYHAMAEKPPGMNWWDVKRLVDAERRTGKCFQLNENVCYERPVQAMRRVIAEGHLGAVVEIDVHFGHGGPYVPYHFSEAGLPHFIDPLWSGGGCLQDLAPHGISRAFWPVGPGARVVSCTTKLLERRQSPRVMSGKPFDNKLDDYAEADLEMWDPRTKRPFSMKVTTSWCGGFAFPFSIEGERGTMSIGQDPVKKAYTPVIFADEGDEYFPLDEDDWDLLDSHAREVQVYCDNLLHGRPSNTPAEYALRLQECISIQYYSKLAKRKVAAEEMEKWAEGIAAGHPSYQDGVDEIARALTGAVDQKSPDSG